MLKQFFIYLVLSILVVLFARYAQLIIANIDVFFSYINLKLTPIFSQTGLGFITRKVLVLMLLPLIIIGIPALIYRAIKGREMPHLIACVWVVWTIIVLSDILIP